MAKTRNRPSSARPHAAIAAQRSKNPMLYVGSLIVLVIITVTFIGTPAIGRFAGGGSGTVFGSYDGIDIEYRRGNYFDRQILSISQQRRAVAAEDSASEARAVVREAYRRAAFRVAVLAETTGANLAVSEERIDSELIRSGPYVIRGVFSEEQYNATPASQQKNNRRLVEEQLLERQYFTDLGALKTSAQAAAFFRQMATTERRFAVASFRFSGLPEAELATYGNDNAALFRRIKLSRILLRGGSGEPRTYWAACAISRPPSRSWRDCIRRTTSPPAAKWDGSISTTWNATSRPPRPSRRSSPWTRGSTPRY